MSHTELTDEPCPKCGASLDLQVAPPLGQPTIIGRPADGDKAAQDTRKTTKIARSFVCPDCGWQQPTDDG